MYFDSVNELCKMHNIKYMPFIGKISGRPSVLEGDIDEMIFYANECLKKGVFGFDLLGYRYADNPEELNQKFVEHVNAPVCIAGSINSYQRLDEIKVASPWAVTIGSAFFENCFDGTILEQINKVYDYISE